MKTETVSEQDVVEFITSKARELSAKTGVGYVNLKCEIVKFRDDEIRVEWCSYVDGDHHRRAETADAAIAQNVAAMAPAERARELREKAAQMLREAEALTV